MKKSMKILFSCLIMASMLSIFGNEFALGKPTEATEEITGDTVNKRMLQANTRTTFRFRQRTRMTINITNKVNLSINCDATNVGTKTFEIDISSTVPLEVNMNCTNTNSGLGLLNGATIQTRNQTRHRYQEGFLIRIQSNGTCQAKLKILATAENAQSTWAFYNETTSQWVTVPTSVQNGYLVAETNHFSTWTVLAPEIDPILIIGVSIGVGALVVLAVVVVIIKKKKK